VTYRLVIFDFDGTLADSASWTARAMIEGADRHGYRRLDAAGIEALRGMDNRAIIRALGVPLWRLPAIVRDMRRRLAAEAGSIPLFPGATAMVEALAAGGMTLAVVTSNTEETVRRIMGPALSARFAFIECGASIFGKAPRLRRVVRRSGIPAGAVIAIGDEARDIEAARAVGISAGAAGWGYATPALLASLRPDLFFGEMEEVAEALLPLSPGPWPRPGSPAGTEAAPLARG
jgi:phosphoglycolate phosphatase